jgi:hypothetical protein
MSSIAHMFRNHGLDILLDFRYQWSTSIPFSSCKAISQTVSFSNTPQAPKYHKRQTTQTISEQCHLSAIKYLQRTLKISKMRPILLILLLASTSFLILAASQELTAYARCFGSCEARFVTCFATVTAASAIAAAIACNSAFGACCITCATLFPSRK